MKKLLDGIKRGATAMAVIAFLGLAPIQAQAAIVTSGCALATQCTLEELDDGGSFIVGSQTYDDWFFDSSFNLSTFDELDLSLGNIFVTPFEGVFGLAGFNIFGAGFGEPFDADWAFAFGFTVSSPTPLLSAGLEFPNSTEDQFSFALADLFNDDGDLVNTAIGVPGIEASELAVPLFGETPIEVLSLFFMAFGEAFDVSQSFVNAVLDGGGDGEPGAVPEPATLLLALIGLGAIGALRRHPQTALQAAV